MELFIFVGWIIVSIAAGIYARTRRPEQQARVISREGL